VVSYFIHSFHQIFDINFFFQKSFTAESAGKVEIKYRNENSISHSHFDFYLFVLLLSDLCVLCGEFFLK